LRPSEVQADTDPSADLRLLPATIPLDSAISILDLVLRACYSTGKSPDASDSARPWQEGFRIQI
jgi:hypothetical protein